MTTYSKRVADERFPQYQFDAETRRIEREQTQPWPAFTSIREVVFRADLNDAGNVVIDVIDGNWHITTRVRNIDDAIPEAVGYAAQAGWMFSAEANTPARFCKLFLQTAKAVQA